MTEEDGGNLVMPVEEARGKSSLDSAQACASSSPCFQTQRLQNFEGIHFHCLRPHSWEPSLTEALLENMFFTH